MYKVENIKVLRIESIARNLNFLVIKLKQKLI